MLGNKNNQKKTVFGGIGVAVVVRIDGAHANERLR